MHARTHAPQLEIKLRVYRGPSEAKRAAALEEDLAAQLTRRMELEKVTNGPSLASSPPSLSRPLHFHRWLLVSYLCSL